MNDGMFIALRGIGQETNSLLMQILEQQKRTNEMLSQLTAPITQEEASSILADTTPKPTKKGK